MTLLKQFQAWTSSGTSMQTALESLKNTHVTHHPLKVTPSTATTPKLHSAEAQVLRHVERHQYSRTLRIPPASSGKRINA
eukprot:364421-Chlamydomonas_euryale.AAC.2